MSTAKRRNMDKVIAQDRYGMAIWIHRYHDHISGECHDLQTDSRVFLDVGLARKLSRELTKFADEQEARAKEQS